MKVLLLISSMHLCLCQGRELGLHRSFSNFPVVSQGAGSEVQAEPRSYQDSFLDNFAAEDYRQRQRQDQVVETEVGTVEGAREARQAGEETLNSPEFGADDFLDDTFIEEAVFISPSDREDRDLAEEGLSFFPEDTQLETDESLLLSSGLDGARGERSHLGQVQVQSQEQRAGRQTGAVAPALGLLNNPSDASGNYNFNFANNDGSSRQEVGGLGAIEGSYSFITPEGEQVKVEYVADETGFHATGSHLPKAPPMPPAIARMLKHLEKVNGVPIVGY